MLKLIRGIIDVPEDCKGAAATMGNFDGVHLGHQQLIKALLHKAQQLQVPSLIITFEPQPNEFFSKGIIPPRLMRLREKLMMFADMGVDYVLCLRFDQQLAQMPAREFIKQFFVDKLQLSHITIGDDFHFGAKRTGDINLLKKLALEYGFSAENIDTFRYSDQRVSSSSVRMALETGDLARAELLLGRKFGIAGRVAHGHKRGRIIGFPTANLFLHRKAVPLQGVFAVKTYGLEVEPILGVANIGNRPTVDGSRSILEVHLFDFDQDIYGRHIYVEFLHKLRDEQRFDSFELLRQQILQDAEQAKKWFSLESEN